MEPRNRPKYPEAGDAPRAAPDDVLPDGGRKRDRQRRGPDGSRDPGTAARPARSGEPAELETYEQPSDRPGVESV